MTDTKDDPGFLSRWSRRKTQARLGDALPEPAAPPATAASAAAESAPAMDPATLAGASPPPRLPDESQAEEDKAAAPRLTLADVAELTPESDFTRFLASDVESGVKNAALKKLFADPHFNLMDGLDVYIDDYSVPSPLPQHMLAKLAQAKFLGLIKEKTEQALASLQDLPADPASGVPPVQAVADAPPTESTGPHEDADLQLQSHDDTGRAGAAPGPGQDTGRDH